MVILRILLSPEVGLMSSSQTVIEWVLQSTRIGPTFARENYVAGILVWGGGEGVLPDLSY